MWKRRYAQNHKRQCSVTICSYLPTGDRHEFWFPLFTMPTSTFLVAPMKVGFIRCVGSSQISREYCTCVTNGTKVSLCWARLHVPIIYTRRIDFWGLSFFFYCVCEKKISSDKEISFFPGSKISVNDRASNVSGNVCVCKCVRLQMCAFIDREDHKDVWLIIAQ